MVKQALTVATVLLLSISAVVSGHYFLGSDSVVGRQIRWRSNMDVYNYVRREIMLSMSGTT